MVTIASTSHWDIIAGSGDIRGWFEQMANWESITSSGVSPYASLDRFGREIACLWNKRGFPVADLARLKYGYNRDSSRQWREDAVGTGFDEYYTYDAVQRLVDMERGTLTGGPPPTGITSATLGQDWDLDATGNWNGFDQTVTDAVTQTRTSNMDNEITSITNSVGTAWTTPVYCDGGACWACPMQVAARTSVQIRVESRSLNQGWRT